MEHIDLESKKCRTIITGWWYTYPSEKYESQMGLLFPIDGKTKKCSKPPTSNIFVFLGCVSLLAISQ